MVDPFVNSWCEYSRGGSESPDDDDSSEDDDDDCDDVGRRFQQVGDDAIKKPVSVDADGYPYGIMKRTLEDDVKLFAKGLDPTVSWEQQPSSEKAAVFPSDSMQVWLFFPHEGCKILHQAMDDAVTADLL